MHVIPEHRLLTQQFSLIQGQSVLQSENTPQKTKRKAKERNE